MYHKEQCLVFFTYWFECTISVYQQFTFIFLLEIVNEWNQQQWRNCKVRTKLTHSSRALAPAISIPFTPSLLFLHLRCTNCLYPINTQLLDSFSFILTTTYGFLNSPLLPESNILLCMASFSSIGLNSLKLILSSIPCSFGCLCNEQLALICNSLEMYSLSAEWQR